MSFPDTGGGHKLGQLWSHFVNKYFLMGPAKDLKKYVEYVFDTKSFTPHFDAGGVSDYAVETARAIRGKGRAPTLFVNGIMPRSGTVFVGELLRLHPDLCAYPRDLFEVPFLQVSEDILGVQERFFLGYRHNVGKLGERDFMPLFAASFIAYLYAIVPESQRMLLKVPGVHYLDRFYSVFPHESLLVLIRDGRDVVQSTIKTWPQLRFSFVCRRWKRSAEMVLACHKHFSNQSVPYWLARFEDVASDPAAFIRDVCTHLNLDESRYPFEKMRELPVRGSSSGSGQNGVTWDPVERPADFNPTGRWHGWSAAKKRIFKRIAGQALVDLGYCEDLDW